MALQSVKGIVYFPGSHYPNTAAPSFTTAVTIDHQNDRVALIVEPTRTGNIDRVAVCVGTITTPADLECRIETVNTTTGAPTGTLFGTTTNGTFTPSADTVGTATLTAAAAVTVGGSPFAIVVQRSGNGTINLTLNRFDPSQGLTIGAMMVPYAMYNLSGSYAQATSLPIVAVRYDDGVWEMFDEALPLVQSFAANAIGTGTGASTGTRRGVRFQVPFTGRLARLRAKILTASLSSDFTVDLYDDAGTLINTVVTKDATYSRAAGATGLWSIPLTTLETLSPGTWYRLVITPTTANTVTIYEAVCNVAAHLDTFAAGTHFHSTAFISSAWSDIDTQRPWWSLGFDQLDDGVGGGGGGGSRGFGMTGGMA